MSARPYCKRLAAVDQNGRRAIQTHVIDDDFFVPAHLSTSELTRRGANDERRGRLCLPARL